MALLLLLIVLALVAGAILVGARLVQPAPEIRSLGNLAYALEDGVYVADWDGQNPRRIVAPSQLPGDVPAGCRAFSGGPTWSPDGRHLAIRTEWNDQCPGSILITDAYGSSVTTIPGSGWLLSWSPDSSRIVTWVALWETIGIYGVDGERQALLPAPGALMSSGDHDPSWTPDGSAVLVPDGVVVPLDGTSPHIDRRFAYSSRSRVSPDGTMIADAQGELLRVVAADGSSQRVLGPVTPSAIGQVLWSPTGDRIAFQGGTGAGIVNVATGATTSLDLPSGPGYIDVVRFSPNGDRVLLSALDAATGSFSLWSVQADGSGARQLVGGSTGGDWQWHRQPSVSDKPQPDLPATGELEVYVRTASPGFDPSVDEVAVYADGRVIWNAGMPEAYVEQRLTREGVEQLRSRAIATGLFERELALGIDDIGWGNMTVRRGDLPVMLAWGQASEDVSGLGLEDRFVRATSAQAVDVTKLQAYLADPTTWGLPDDVYVQREFAPFVPSQLWVGYDRSEPKLTNLPSPAREVVRRILEPVLLGRCQNISIDQAREVANALVRAGIIAPDYDVRLGFEFTVPSSTSLVHAHAVLPHDVGTICGQE
jgi:Tol biopolymer transport system component